jgi:hypothetical protein
MYVAQGPSDLIATIPEFDKSQSLPQAIVRTCIIRVRIRSKEAPLDGLSPVVGFPTLTGACYWIAQ